MKILFVAAVVLLAVAQIESAKIEAQAEGGRGRGSGWEHTGKGGHGGAGVSGHGGAGVSGHGGAGVSANVGLGWGGRGGGRGGGKGTANASAKLSQAFAAIKAAAKGYKRAEQLCEEFENEQEVTIVEFLQTCKERKCGAKFIKAAVGACNAMGIDIDFEACGVKEVTNAAVQAVQKVLKLVQGILAKVLGQLSAFLQEKLPEIAGTVVAVLNALLPHIIEPLAQCVPEILKLVGLVIAECPADPKVNNETATSKTVDVSTQGAGGKKW